MGPQHENDKCKFLYFNNLKYLFEKYTINTWVYGHVHYNKCFKIKNCNCISNQLGRKKDNVKDYIKNFTYKF